jgi:hypothetical protein
LAKAQDIRPIPVLFGGRWFRAAEYKQRIEYGFLETKSRSRFVIS